MFLHSGLVPGSEAFAIRSRFSLNLNLLEKKYRIQNVLNSKGIKIRLTLSMAMSVAVFGSTISPLSSMRGVVLRE